MSSHLVLTVLAKSVMTSEIFLGEVVIPLLEVETMGAHEEVRAYTLGRRRGKEKVTVKSTSMFSNRMILLYVCTDNI